ncbi:sulfotransferase family 2 domain-containing protein [uncultured Desulfosarcina sp.]|uniref:sulfotransferase family 2 domain-containing protein n=1 Tax=uncultured Desulfosarcina sp. TaxID=218289 RepID=UPI0029C992CE|nr:sulfotransferase family 2 domain-containing protein [uncultured Desulfosarcina sp.]
MKKNIENLIAFVHIEKAAGQTFIRILENNFKYKHCRVAPLNKKNKGIFSVDDLKLILKINPFTQAISGHSIKPFSNLATYIPHIRYVTILRDPVERYISHYQYWVKVLKKNIKFEDFLKLDSMRDFQTKKIAGAPIIQEAKRILSDEFFLVGVLENFDYFLALLKIKLSPYEFNCEYKKKNVAKNNFLKVNIDQKLEKYKKEILFNNRNDIELYSYAKNYIFQKQKEAALLTTNEKNIDFENSYHYQMKNELIGKLYRNLYYGPIFSFLRYKNGLDIKGSY